MNYKLFNYLKKKGLTDPSQVNSLFVSAYVLEKGWHVEHCSVIARQLDNNNLKVTDFIRVLKDNGFAFNLEELIKLFECVISPADRIVTGAVYTPEKIRNTIIRRSLEGKGSEELRRARIADISCGCGGFLMDAALWIYQHTGKTFESIFRDNIYGIDIQDYSIERTKVLLCLLALNEGEDADFEFNLLCRDTLDYSNENWSPLFRGFDVIVGNPPYVCARNLPKKTYAKLTDYKVCASGHPDLYIPFFQIATEMLNDGGRLGYITMNTFLRSVNGRAVRKYFSHNRYSISIVDFRGYQVFDSKNTYTCLFYLEKRRGNDTLYYAVDEKGELAENVQYEVVSYDNLNDEKGWSLNAFDLTAAIDSVGTPIKDYCPSRHGIATLSNDTFIFRQVAEDGSFYIHESEGTRYLIEREICRDIVNPNKLNSVDDLESLYEKVIYPYHVENGRAVIYSPGEMRDLFPQAYAYLIAKKTILMERDKGDTGDYPQWYAYGRTQSLVLPRFKLFFPKFANKNIRCAVCDSPDLMLYNGLAFISTEKRKLLILKAIIESDLFWKYIQANGKPYASG